MKTLVAACLLVVALASSAATYHVSTAGNDSNDGSEGSPWRTIAKALPLVSPGDTVLVTGSHAETLNTAVAGSSGNPITWRGLSNGHVHRIIADLPYQTFDNLLVSGFNQNFGHLIYIRRGAHFITVTNCVVDGTNAMQVNGIFWETPSTKPFGNSGSHAVIVSNRITQILGATALSVMGGSNVIRGNYVHDVGSADFVRLWGQANLITGNTFSNNFHVPGVGNHIDFIQTFGTAQFGSEDHVIERNKVLKIVGGQITQLEGNLVPEIRNWTFRNNLFADTSLGASQTIPGLRWYNNTFYRINQNNNNGAALFFGRRVYTLSNNWAAGTNYAHGAQVFNNVFIDVGSTGTNQGYYGFSLDLEGVAADRNYVGKNGYQPVRVDSLQRPIGDPGGWDDFRWWEPNGINGGDPLLSDIGNLDFRHATNSILADAGASLSGFADDYFGTSRPQGADWDIGYFEVPSDFTPPDPDPAPPAPPVLRRVLSGRSEAGSIRR